MKLTPRRRVLVIDDKRDSLLMLSLLIKELGHDAQIATGGTAAILAARRFGPHVIFLDLVLPDFDGVALAKQLKDDPLLVGTRIYILTGHADEAARSRAYDAGCAGYFLKPLDPRILESVLKS